MRKDEENEYVNRYLRSIDHLLPYPDVLKRDALGELRQDVLEAWEDLTTQHSDPEERYQALLALFGFPEEAARNLCQANEWHRHRAGFTHRMISYLIDGILSLFMSVIPLIPVYMFRATEEPHDAPTFVLRLVILLTFGTLSSLAIIGYFIFFEVKFTTTPGKRLLGLKVVSEAGIRITWQQGIIRNFTRIRGELLLLDVLIGKFIMKLDRQRAMDKLAETIVIKTKKSKIVKIKDEKENDD